MHAAWSRLFTELNLSPRLTDTGHTAFANLNDEVAALDGAALSPLSHLGLLRVEGEEAVGFLHNLGSNDIKKLPVGGVQWNSLNSAKGRMLASFLVWRDEQGFSLVLADDLAAEICKKLSMYVLRAKVKVSNLAESVALVGVSGQHAADFLARAELAVPEGATQASPSLSVVRVPGQSATPRYLLAVSADELALRWPQWLTLGAQLVGTAAWAHDDIIEGIPLITRAIHDEFVAQMVNFELLGGVNFQKGCYPGQEIVARTQYLGKLKKRMYRAHVEASASAPLPGLDLYAPAFGEQSCGKVVSACPAVEGGYEVLAVIQMAAHEANDVRLGAIDGATLRFAPLPYTVD